MSKDIIVNWVLPGVREVNIFHFAVLRAGYLTLFVNKENATAVYKEFRKFDRLLCKLARNSLNQGKLDCFKSSPLNLLSVLVEYVAQKCMIMNELMSALQQGNPKQ